MAKVRPIQTNFTAGELSKLLEGRVDLSKYKNGLRKLQNYLVRPHGPVTRRSGSRYIAQTETMTELSRLIPFQFSEEQAYILEFGNLYVRFYKDQGQIANPDNTIVLLFHFNENNGAVLMTDDSGQDHDIDNVVDFSNNASSTARISTDQSKFGTGSLLLNGTADHLFLAHDATDYDFTDENWTFDCWVRPDNELADNATIMAKSGTPTTDDIKLQLTTFTKLLLRMNGTDESNTFTDDSISAHTVTDKGWVLLLNFDGTDGATTTTDTSPSGHTPTMLNGAEISNDVSSPVTGGNTVLHLDGSDDIITIPASSDFDFSANDVFTISFWFYSENPNSSDIIISSRTDNLNNFSIFTASSTLRATVEEGGVVRLVQSLGTISANTWHHAEFSCDGTNYLLFLDGTLENSVAVGGVSLIQYSRPWVIGAREDHTSDGLYNFHFPGYIDSIAVTGGRVLHTASFTKPTTPYFRTELDTSINKFGTASARFDGLVSRLEMADSSDFNFSSDDKFTISAWIYMDVVPSSSGSANDYNICSQVTDTNNEFIVRINSSDVLVFRIETSGLTQTVIGTSTLVAGTWYHIEITGDGINYNLFVDGTRETQETITVSTADLTGKIYIGAWDNPNTSVFDSHFQGRMDDIRILNKAAHTATFEKPVSRHNMFHPKFIITNTSSTATLEKTEGDETIDADSWHHVEISADGTIHYLFANGDLETSANMAQTLPALGNELMIGAYNHVTPANFFKGYIDEVRIFSSGSHIGAFSVKSGEYGVDGPSALTMESGDTNNDYAVPYIAADLADIKIAQSYDTLYIFHKNYITRKLTRASHTAWQMNEVYFDPPPTRVQKFEPATTLTTDASADTAGASSTATSGANAFVAADIGRLIIAGGGSGVITAIPAANQATFTVTDPFLPSNAYAANKWGLLGSPISLVEIRTAAAGGGTVVEAKKGDTVYLYADVNTWRATTDDDKYVRLHGGFFKIVDAAVSANERDCQATCISDTDDSAAGVATQNWTLEEAIFSGTDGTASVDGNGYPSCGAFYEERLFLGGVPAFPQTVLGSVTGGYEDHTPGSDPADAVQFSFAGKEANIIKWMEEGKVLIVGTTGGEWRVGSTSLDEPITPSNIFVKRQTTHGSNEVAPVTIGQAILFLQKTGRKVRELVYSFEADGYVAPDMTLLAEHISVGGIKSMAYQQEPFSTLWCVRNDGSLIALTYLREQEVVGWHSHVIGGTDTEVESVAVIPGSVTSDAADEVWIIVKRTINGATKRYVEMIEQNFDIDSGDTISDAFFVDSGKTDPDTTTLKTTISGLSHLEGEAVSVLADGIKVTGKTVSSGAITLATGALVVHVGLKYSSVLQTMRPEAGGEQGTAQGWMKKIRKVFVRMSSTLGLQIGPSETDLKTIRDTDSALISDPDDVEVDFHSGWEDDGFITIVQDEPYPSTIISIMAEVDQS